MIGNWPENLVLVQKIKEDDYYFQNTALIAPAMPIYL
jgi:hypothetical protein